MKSLFIVNKKFVNDNYLIKMHSKLKINHTDKKQNVNVFILYSKIKHKFFHKKPYK